MLAGTFGFAYLENLSFLHSFYFTLITVATVGYGDITPHTQAGKILAMLVIVFGVGTFLGVIASGTEMLLERREREQRRQKLNMVLGLFFGEVGTGLLSGFSKYDARVGQIERNLLINERWEPGEFTKIQKLVAAYEPDIQVQGAGLDEFKGFLNEKSDFLVRLFENPNLLEHEGFTELLRALLHLKEELALRKVLTDLPETDYRHLSGDINRVYRLLLVEWVAYMKYLKLSFPYLFSLALRTNPFDGSASPIAPIPGPSFARSKTMASAWCSGPPAAWAKCLIGSSPPAAPFRT